MKQYGHDSPEQPHASVGLRSPMIVRIYSENANFQIISALKTNRQKKSKLGFLFEGVRNINNALTYGWKLNAYVYSPEVALSDWARDILKNSAVSTHYQLSPELLMKLSDKTKASELLAIGRIPDDDFGKIALSEDLLVAIFDRPSNPGNLGALIRSCDALGVDGLIITGHGVDVYDTETISAATGSIFSLPIVRLQSQTELASWISKVRLLYKDLQIVGTDENGLESIYEHDFRGPTILLVGNEKWGLSAGYREMADVIAHIPMEGGSASSLNVAVATSIVIAEVGRQRRSRNAIST